MLFGDVALEDAEGAILAHSILLPDGKIAKGHLLEQHDLARLRESGIRSVIVARLEDGDLNEDEAAQRMASAIVPLGMRFSAASTGRVNIFAEVNGLFVVSRDIIDRLNRIDPAITIATLPDHAQVAKGAMVATIKIIPLAVQGRKVAQAVALLSAGTPFQVKPFAARKVGLVATMLPSLKLSVMDKTRDLLDHRLSASGSRIGSETRVAHRDRAVADAIRQLLPDHGMIIVFGASAVTDEHDVIPEAIRMAGGAVEQVGLPVDPGNLLVLGHIGDVPVIGAPGCARSPKENAFDWVLARILAGENPDRDVLTGWGVGGLLMEIPTRPRPRALKGDTETGLRIGVVILAAGQATRMGVSGHHKLLAEFDGEALVRRSARTVLASSADEKVVVTGHRADDIKSALSGLPIETVDNPDYASGMASSIRVGLGHFADRIDGLMVVLADMPAVATADLDAMMAAFRAHEGKAIIRAVAGGKRGNPVILPAATFDAILKLEGDIGARPIIEKSGLETVDIDIGAAAHLDVDTPEAIIAAGGILKG